MDMQMGEKILEKLSYRDNTNELEHMGGPNSRARKTKVRNEISNTFKVMVPHTKKTTRVS